jgi:hypothetical protein
MENINSSKRMKATNFDDSAAIFLFFYKQKDFILILFYDFIREIIIAK